MKHKFDKGSLGENIPWEIETDYCTSGYGSACAHCVEIFPGHPRHDAKGGRRQYICPAVVTAFNQAGYDATSVCLQCVLENAERLGLIVGPSAATERPQ